MSEKSEAPGSAPPREVVDYYARYPEEERLQRGSFLLEFERTKELLRRFLPSAPASVVDVGGAAGAYSFFLADLGYDVHLVDLSARLVEEARRRNAGRERPVASFAAADARRLPQADGSADAVLVMGPLYHLPDAADRLAALREAHRVLQAPGIVIVAAISRYASTLDGLVHNLAHDSRFMAIRDRDLVDGQHRNDTGVDDYFTTSYFHRPEDLRAELESAGFEDAAVLGVEGPGWQVPDFEARWADEIARNDLLKIARAVESAPSILGVSAHLLGVGRKAR